MKFDPAPDPGLQPAPTKTTDGRTMIGYVVVCEGFDENFESAVAVWHVNTAGVSVGAWVVPLDLAMPEPAAARTILQLCLRRAVMAWDTGEALSILTTLERTAGVTGLPWSESMITLPDMLEEIRLTRSAYEKQTAAERQMNKKIATIDWPVELPLQLPATANDLRQIIHLALPETSPVAHNALLTSNLVRWTLQRWQETMNALKRRRYLQRDFGPPSQLPVAWETRLADAYERNR